jgi:hypothetical protein
LPEKEDLFELISNIKEFLSEINSAGIFIGEILSEIKEHALFRQYKNDVKYWNQFLDMIGISVSEANAYMNMYKKLPNSVAYKISPFRVRKAVRASMQYGADIEELLSLAENAPHKDFNDHFNSLRGTPSYLECEHEETKAFRRCAKCGKWFKAEEGHDHEEAFSPETEEEIR